MRLPNAFNQVSMLGHIDNRLSSMIQGQIEKKLMGPKGGVDVDPSRALSASETEGDGTKRAQAYNSISVEKCTLDQHFDVDKVLSIKCLVGVCYKAQNRRFLLKRLPVEVMELQKLKHQINSEKA